MLQVFVADVDKTRPTTPVMPTRGFTQHYAGDYHGTAPLRGPTHGSVYRRCSGDVE